MRPLPLLLLASCASLSLQYGETSPHDVVCGKVGNVELRLRPGAFMTCPEETRLATKALRAERVHGPWTIIIGNAPAGWDIGRDMGVHYFAGMTYPKTRVIALQHPGLGLLLHELGHASDIEHGLPNTRDPH